MVKSSVNPHKFRWFWWWISDGYGWWRIYLVSYVILFGNRTLRRLGRRYFRWIGRRYFWGLGTSRQKLTLSIFGLWPSLSLIVYPSLSLTSNPNRHGALTRHHTCLSITALVARARPPLPRLALLPLVSPPPHSNALRFFALIMCKHRWNFGV
jgi:hypothetical protein